MSEGHRGKGRQVLELDKQLEGNPGSRLLLSHTLNSGVPGGSVTSPRFRNSGCLPVFVNLQLNTNAVNRGENEGNQS